MCDTTDKPRLVPQIQIPEWYFEQKLRGGKQIIKWIIAIQGCQLSRFRCESLASRLGLTSHAAQCQTHLTPNEEEASKPVL